MELIRKELGGDHWVDLIDPDELTSKQYTKIDTAFRAGMASSPYAAVMSRNDHVLITCVRAWSFRPPVPRSVQEISKLDDVPLKPWKRLLKTIADYAANFDVTDEEADPPKPSDD